MKLLVIFLLISFLSFSQNIEFNIKTIGLESSLKLLPNNTFVMKRVIWACQGEDFHYSEYKGEYQINNNTLLLKPNTEAFIEGTAFSNISLQNIEKNSENNKLNYNDFTPSKYLATKFEILRFTDFQVLIEQMDDLIKLSNYLNSISEFTVEDSQWIKQNFFTTPINQFPISKEELLKNPSVKNKKEILQNPIITRITSVEESVIKNKNYDSRIDVEDAKYITQLYIELDAGTDDGVFNGMVFYPISENECAIFGLYVEKVTRNKSYVKTEKLLDDGFCDPDLYDINRKVSTQL